MKDALPRLQPQLCLRPDFVAPFLAGKCVVCIRKLEYGTTVALQHVGQGDDQELFRGMAHAVWLSGAATGARPNSAR